MAKKPKELGPQDPDMKNSPIAWETGDENDVLGENMPAEAACFFNNHEYPHGTIVSSDAVRLRCDHGVWVPAAAADPSNP